MDLDEVVDIKAQNLEAFRRAWRGSDLSHIKRLIEEQKFNVNRYVDHTGKKQIPLINAIGKRCMPLAILLIEYGADLGKKGGWPLVEELKQEKDVNIELVRHMLDKGADPNSSEEDVYVLAIAVDTHRLDVMRLLLDRGADPNQGTGYPLWNAVITQQIEAARLLLDRGANPNLDDVGQLLLRAVEFEHLDMVQLLLEHGIDANSSDRMPLDEALNRADIEIMKCLLMKGAIATINHLTEAIEAKRPDIVQLLLDSGILSRGSNTMNIYLSAIRYGNTTDFVIQKIIELILNHASQLANVPGASETMREISKDARLRLSALLIK